MCLSGRHASAAACPSFYTTGKIILRRVHPKCNLACNLSRDFPPRIPASGCLARAWLPRHLLFPHHFTVCDSSQQWQRLSKQSRT